MAACVAEWKRLCPKGKCWRGDFEMQVFYAPAFTLVKVLDEWHREAKLTPTANSISPEVLLLRSKSGKLIKSKNNTKIRLLRHEGLQRDQVHRSSTSYMQLLLGQEVSDINKRYEADLYTNMEKREMHSNIQDAMNRKCFTVSFYYC